MDSRTHITMYQSQKTIKERNLLKGLKGKGRMKGLKFKEEKGIRKTKETRLLTSDLWEPSEPTKTEKAYPRSENLLFGRKRRG